MPAPNAHLTLRLSPVTSNRDPGNYMSLVIEDAVSHQRVAEFQLLGEHLLQLLGTQLVGGVDGMPAWLIEPVDRPTLNVRMYTTLRKFKTYDHNDDTLRRWAESGSRALGAHQYRMSADNAGMYRVTFIYYLDAEHGLEAAQCRSQASMDALRAPAADR